MTSPWPNLSLWSDVTSITSVPAHVTLSDAAATVTDSVLSAITENSTTSECVRIAGLSRSSRCNAGTTSVMTRQERLLTEDVVYMGLLPVVAVIGAVTNAINCVVFCKQGLKDRVNMCLFCQCLADFLFVITLVARYMDKTLVHILQPGWGDTVWTATLIRYRLVAVHSGFATISNLVSTVIAVERCVCVTWPLRAAHMLSTHRLAGSIAVGSVIIFAGKQFVAFKYDVMCAVPADDPLALPTILVLPSRLYIEHSTLLDVLDSIIFSSLVPCLSLGVITVCTAVTAVKLRQATAWRSATTVGGGTRSGTDVINRKEVALTRMLIALSCVFLVCVTPRVVRSLSRMLVPEFRAWGSLCNIMIATQAVTNILIAVNSSVNFFLFYSLGSRYRLTLHRLLASCGRYGATRTQTSTPMVSTVTNISTA